MKRGKWIAIGLCVVFALGLGGAVWWYVSSDPLVSDGLSSYQIGQERGVVLQISNEGYGNIKLLSVEVNGQTPPTPVSLGIAYDTGQFVQVLPDPHPHIRFMDLQASPIYPKPSPEEMKEALNKQENTPIHYGIRIIYDEEQPIRSVTIRYKYLGFTKTAKITKWFEYS